MESQQCRATERVVTCQGKSSARAPAPAAAGALGVERVRLGARRACLAGQPVDGVAGPRPEQLLVRLLGWLVRLLEMCLPEANAAFVCRWR